MSAKTQTVKVTKRYSKDVLAEVVLTPAPYGGMPVGAEPYWKVTLDGVLIGYLHRFRQAESYSLGGGSRLARSGSVRTWFDGRDAKGRNVSYTVMNATRVDVLRAMVEQRMEELSMAAAEEEAKVQQHWARVENLPGYAQPEAPEGVVYAGYWMDRAHNLPVAVYRSADINALTAFAKSVQGTNGWEEGFEDRGTATVTLTMDAKLATRGAEYNDSIRDDVTKVALR